MRPRYAAITGASRGIGAAIAEKFASEGWNLALSCLRSSETLEALASRLHNTYKITCLTYTGDMGEEPSVREFFRKIQENFGTLDVLVNNAGISQVGLFGDLTLSQW